MQITIVEWCPMGRADSTKLDKNTTSVEVNRVKSMEVNYLPIVQLGPENQVMQVRYLQKVTESLRVEYKV